MIALADCNNFYASCERLFQPQYKGVPVVVLSNNDGCVIARSNEAKEIGISMGVPFFQIREMVIEHNIAVFSSHYTLYGDISSRVMTNIARFTPDVEVYSIDECFFGLYGIDNLEEYTTNIRSTVIRNTGIPISIGVAPSKVLAKVANKLGKKSNGVCVLDSPEKITEALKKFPIEDLWGIGRKHAERLKPMGVDTADKFRNLPIDWVQKNLTIVGVRMWRELWGQSCIKLKQKMDPKKVLTTSRAFGDITDNLTYIEEATASYAGRLAQKLRRERLCCKTLSVKLLTNVFNPNQPQYFPFIEIQLPNPVNNTNDLAQHALKGLRAIYKSGYLYKKVEVTASDLIPETEVQLNMFVRNNSPKLDKLSRIMDNMNLHYGNGTLRLATEGVSQNWNLKRDFLSPEYTTNWSDIVKVR